MHKIIQFLIVGVFALFIVQGCSKEPGPGGNASIQGKILIQSFNSNCSALISEYYGVDQDVYLIYGDNPSYSERVRTGPGGVYWFPYLRKGEYTVYAISETCSPVGGDTISAQTVTINDKDETVQLEDIIVIR